MKQNKSSNDALKNQKEEFELVKEKEESVEKTLNPSNEMMKPAQAPEINTGFGSEPKEDPKDKTIKEVKEEPFETPEDTSAKTPVKESAKTTFKDSIETPVKDSEETSVKDSAETPVKDLTETPVKNSAKILVNNTEETRKETEAGK